MLCRVKYEPPASPDAQVRFNLPTYGLFGHDPVELTAIVDVPEADFPPELLDADIITWKETHAGFVAVGMNDDAHADWHKHLEERYREHAGTFRPQLV